MKIVKEIRLSQFPFWSGAQRNAEKLTTKEFAEIENYLEEYCIEPLDETWINDFFWFEFEYICESILGYTYNVKNDEIIR